MLARDLVQEVYFSLSANKARSTLTILGIVIGIGSVIAMVSIGQGTAFDIQSRVESLGSNLLVVMPGSSQASGSIVQGGMGSADTLTIDDAEAIFNNVSNLDAVAPYVSSRKQVTTTKGTNTNTSIYGVTSSYQTVKTIEIETGSFLSDIHIDKMSKVAVLGPAANTDLFGEGVDSVGQKIRIEGQQFTVIGITVEKGGTGFGSQDDLIYIPITTAQTYLLGSDSVSSINVQVATTEGMTQAQNDITDLLLQRHNIADSNSADFSIVNQADILDTMADVSNTLTLLLAAIAGISLLVGGIGIMNMMLTTVTERTREIGLRKSLGATAKDIGNQFLSESVALTFIGGIIGIILGWGASYLITKYGGTTTVVSTQSVILAFGVSALIGIIFGYYPAQRAGKLHPIEALRYE